jgi:hypothetical protein
VYLSQVETTGAKVVVGAGATPTRGFTCRS